MTTYTVEFTQTEELAMQYVAADVNEWIQNATHERARIAIEEIVQLAVQKFIETNQQIPSTKEEIVAAAFANGWVITGLQRNEPSRGPIVNVTQPTS